MPVGYTQVIIRIFLIYLFLFSAHALHDDGITKEWAVPPGRFLWNCTPVICILGECLLITRYNSYIYNNSIKLHSHLVSGTLVLSPLTPC